MVWCEGQGPRIRIQRPESIHFIPYNQVTLRQFVSVEVPCYKTGVPCLPSISHQGPLLGPTEMIAVEMSTADKCHGHKGGGHTNVTLRKQNHELTSTHFFFYCKEVINNKGIVRVKI